MRPLESTVLSVSLLAAVAPAQSSPQEPVEQKSKKVIVTVAWGREERRPLTDPNRRLKGQSTPS